LKDGVIIANNPAIWRPILAIRDAADAYIRSVESAPEISGIFNVASGNYTIGELADYVSEGVREFTGKEPSILVRNVQDIRNYKVSWEKARNVLGFHPQRSVKDIVKELVENLPNFRDFDNPAYYNIQTFESLEGQR